jgi:hypothetical protein
MNILQRIDWKPILSYLGLSLALSAVIVGASVALGISPPLAQTVLFGLLGGLAYTFGVKTTLRVWKGLAALWWIAAATVFMLYFIVQQVVSPAFGILLLFMAQAAVLMTFAVRRPAPKSLSEGAVTGWRALETGTRAEQPVTNDR